MDWERMNKRRVDRHSRPPRSGVALLWAVVVGFFCGGVFMAWLARDVFLSRYETPPSRTDERSVDVVSPDRAGEGIPGSGDDREKRRTEGGGSPSTSYVALVLDDCGYSMKLARRVRSLNLPITWAILPGSPYGKDTAELLSGEVPFLVHVPMQAKSDPVEPEGRGTLYEIGVGMSDREVAQALKPLLDAFPGAYGINNHRGSKATEDASAMRSVMKVLKARNLFFLDSATSSNSVAYRIAVENGLNSAKNEAFLDNVLDAKEIASQFENAVKEARSKKTKKNLVAICHLRPETVNFLETLSRNGPGEGVVLVTLPQLMKNMRGD